MSKMQLLQEFSYPSGGYFGESREENPARLLFAPIRNKESDESLLYPLGPDKPFTAYTRRFYLVVRLDTEEKLVNAYFVDVV